MCYGDQRGKGYCDDKLLEEMRAVCRKNIADSILEGVGVTCLLRSGTGLCS